MTSTNDGKDVKSNQTSGPKGKTYYIELYKSLEAGLVSGCKLAERTEFLCEAWRRVYTLCQHSVPSTQAHLLSWLQRHTYRTLLQTEWQLPTSTGEHSKLDAAISSFILECQNEVSVKQVDSPPWQWQLIQRGKWFQKILANPWGHPVLKRLLDPNGDSPTNDEVLQWLKEERGVMFVTRLRQLATSKKCDDLALLLASTVMDRARAEIVVVADADQVDETKEKPNSRGSSPTFADILKTDAGFTVDVWEFITDLEFVLLLKGGKRSRCIQLAKQTPLRDGCKLAERLHSRLEMFPLEKKLWKNAKDVATLIAEMVVARCMVVPLCAGAVRRALYCTARVLARTLPAARLPAEAASLAAPAHTARHLHTLAAAVRAELQNTKEMIPFMCSLYVRAITAGMNELERLKLKTEMETEARSAEKTLATWFTQLGSLLSASDRIQCECVLTAFSVHPSPDMYEKIKSAPILPPVAVDHLAPKEGGTTSEFGSWASDSRSMTNLVKTSETLNLKQTQHQANVLSTAILTEGEGLGLHPDTCEDIAVLLSGPRLKTLSWDMDRDILLEHCRAYMERTHGGTKAVTTELKYLKLDPKAFQHLPEEEDEENDVYYGIEKGYEHLVEFQEPEEMWDAAFIHPEIISPYASSTESEISTTRRKKKNKKATKSSEDDSDPLSYMAEAKRKEKKKVRPHSKERSKERRKKKETGDPLASRDNSQDSKVEISKKGKKKEKKERKKKDDSKPKPKSLAHLVGMKVTNLGNKYTSSITDSDYDSQGKSSLNSLNSEGTEDVVFDGLYSMDELKSPELVPNDNMGLMKNNEVSITDGIVAVNKPAVVNKKDVTNNALPSSVEPEASSTGLNVPRQPYYDTVKEEVKRGISRLIEFRRKKKALDKLAAKEQNKSTLNTSTSTNRMPSAIVRPESPSPSQISPKVVAIPEIPKMYINKAQSEQIAKLKNELDKYLNVTNNFNNSTYSGTKLRQQDIERNRIYKPPEPNDTNDPVADLIRRHSKHFQNMPSQSRPINMISDNINLIKQVPSTPIVQNIPKPGNSTENVKQNSIQNFLKELQESINAGAGVYSADKTTAHNAYTRKEIKPMSRPTPVMPVNIKNDNKISPSAKPQTQPKKLDTSLNTFSRLSYMYKNKQNDVKIQQLVNALIEHQDQSLKKRPNQHSLDRVVIKQNNSRAKCSQLKNEALPRPVKTAPPAKLNNNLLNKKFEKASTSANQNANTCPVITSILQNNPTSSPKYAEVRNDIHTKITTQQNQVRHEAKSTLSEKDQNDILLLLRQQNKLNASYSTAKRDITYNSSSGIIAPIAEQSISNNVTSTKFNASVELPSTTKDIQASKPFIYERCKTKKPSILAGIKVQNDTIAGQKTWVPKPNAAQNQNKTNSVERNSVVNAEVKNDNKIPHKIDVSKITKTATDWEKVMDAILAQKTPSRGPKALDIALNKSSFAKAFSDSLQNQTLLKCSSMEDLVGNKVINLNQILSSGDALTITSANKSDQDAHNPVLKKFSSRILSSDSKHNSKNSYSKPLSNSSDVPLVSITKSHLSEAQRKANNQEPHRKLSSEELKKQFTCPLPKDDDPFISGIANSDYDLLEELMDDDLRQEIGELSTDEDDYNPSAPNVSKRKNITEKRVAEVYNKLTNAMATASTSPVDLCTNHTDNAKQRITQMPNMKCDNKMASAYVAPIQTVLVNDNKSRLQLARNLSVITPTPLKNELAVTADNILPTLGPSNIYIAAAPKQRYQNVVVIKNSDIMYDDAYHEPQTSIQSTINNIEQKSYDAGIKAPNEEFYHTCNELIIENCMNDPMPQTCSSKVTSSVAVPVAGFNRALQDPKIVVAVNHKQNDNYSKPDLTNASTNNEETINNILPENGDLDFNSNKNFNTHLVSEIEQDKIIQKKDTEIKAISNNYERQERLAKKRISIINRKLFYQSDNEAIPLSFITGTNYNQQPPQEETLPKIIDDIETVSDTNKIERETDKANKYDESFITSEYKQNRPEKVTEGEFRRIFLRSSNKLIDKSIFSKQNPKKVNQNKINVQIGDDTTEKVTTVIGSKDKGTLKTRTKNRNPKKGSKTTKIVESRGKNKVSINSTTVTKNKKSNKKIVRKIANSTKLHFLDIENELLGSKIPKFFESNANILPNASVTSKISQHVSSSGLHDTQDIVGHVQRGPKSVETELFDDLTQFSCDTVSFENIVKEKALLGTDFQKENTAISIPVLTSTDIETVLEKEKLLNNKNISSKENVSMNIANSKEISENTEVKEQEPNTSIMTEINSTQISASTLSLDVGSAAFFKQVLSEIEMAKANKLKQTTEECKQKLTSDGTDQKANCGQKQNLDKIQQDVTCEEEKQKGSAEKVESIQSSYECKQQEMGEESNQTPKTQEFNKIQSNDIVMRQVIVDDVRQKRTMGDVVDKHIIQNKEEIQTVNDAHKKHKADEGEQTQIENKLKCKETQKHTIDVLHHEQTVESREQVQTLKEVKQIDDEGKQNQVICEIQNKQTQEDDEIEIIDDVEHKKTFDKVGKALPENVEKIMEKESAKVHNENSPICEIQNKQTQEDDEIEIIDDVEHKKTFDKVSKVLPENVEKILEKEFAKVHNEDSPMCEIQNKQTQDDDEIEIIDDVEYKKTFDKVGKMLPENVEKIMEKESAKIHNENSPTVNKRNLVDNVQTIQKVSKPMSSRATTNKQSQIPQSYKDSIRIEQIPNTSKDPLKKCLRIKLPNGRTFKATVHGKVLLNVDTLFEEPSLKALLLSSLTDKKFYTLNIKQVSTASVDNPSKIVETRIQEINIEPKTAPKLVETINLLSDDEDEEVCQYFQTEYGKYRIKPLSNTVLSSHQKKFNLKCRVEIIRQKLVNHEKSDIGNGTSKNLSNKEVYHEQINITKRQLRRNPTPTQKMSALLQESEVIQIDDSSNESFAVIQTEHAEPDNKIEQTVYTDTFKDLNMNCYVKLIKCDDLVKKNETLRALKQKCYVDLVRIDSRNLNHVNMRDLSDDYEGDNNQSRLTTRSEKIINGRTSPVMEAYELIVKSHKKSSEKLIMHESKEHEKQHTYLCKSSWLETKRTFSEIAIINKYITSRNGYRHSHFADTGINEKLFTYSDETSNPPDLKTLLLRYFQNSPTLNYTFLTCTANISKYYPMWRNSYVLKRKLISNDNVVANKVSKLSTDGRRKQNQVTENEDSCTNKNISMQNSEVTITIESPLRNKEEIILLQTTPYVEMERIQNNIVEDNHILQTSIDNGNFDLDPDRGNAINHGFASSVVQGNFDNSDSNVVAAENNTIDKRGLHLKTNIEYPEIVCAIMKSVSDNTSYRILQSDVKSNTRQNGIKIENIPMQLSQYTADSMRSISLNSKESFNGCTHNLDIDKLCEITINGYSDHENVSIQTGKLEATEQNVIKSSTSYPVKDQLRSNILKKETHNERRRIILSENCHDINIVKQTIETLKSQLSETRMELESMTHKTQDCPSPIRNTVKLNTDSLLENNRSDIISAKENQCDTVEDCNYGMDIQYEAISAASNETISACRRLLITDMNAITKNRTEIETILPKNSSDHETIFKDCDDGVPKKLQITVHNQTETYLKSENAIVMSIDELKRTELVSLSHSETCENNRHKMYGFVAQKMHNDARLSNKPLESSNYEISVNYKDSKNMVAKEGKILESISNMIGEDSSDATSAINKNSHEACTIDVHRDTVIENYDNDHGNLYENLEIQVSEAHLDDENMVAEAQEKLASTTDSKSHAIQIECERIKAKTKELEVTVQNTIKNIIDTIDKQEDNQDENYINTSHSETLAAGAYPEAENMIVGTQEELGSTIKNETDNKAFVINFDSEGMIAQTPELEITNQNATQNIIEIRDKKNPNGNEIPVNCDTMIGKLHNAKGNLNEPIETRVAETGLESKNMIVEAHEELESNIQNETENNGIPFHLESENKTGNTKEFEIKVQNVTINITDTINEEKDNQENISIDTTHFDIMIEQLDNAKCNLNKSFDTPVAETYLESEDMSVESYEELESKVQNETENKSIAIHFVSQNMVSNRKEWEVTVQNATKNVIDTIDINKDKRDEISVDVTHYDSKIEKAEYVKDNLNALFENQITETQLESENMIIETEEELESTLYNATANKSDIYKYNYDRDASSDVNWDRNVTNNPLNHMELPAQNAIENMSDKNNVWHKNCIDVEQSDTMGKHSDMNNESLETLTKTTHIINDKIEIIDVVELKSTVQNSTANDKKNDYSNKASINEKDLDSRVACINVVNFETVKSLDTNANESTNILDQSTETDCKSDNKICQPELEQTNYNTIKENKTKFNERNNANDEIINNREHFDNIVEISNSNGGTNEHLKTSEHELIETHFEATNKSFSSQKELEITYQNTIEGGKTYVALIENNDASIGVDHIINVEICDDGKNLDRPSEVIDHELAENCLESESKILQKEEKSEVPNKNMIGKNNTDVKHKENNDSDETCSDVEHIASIVENSHTYDGIKYQNTVKESPCDLKTVVKDSNHDRDILNVHFDTDDKRTYIETVNNVNKTLGESKLANQNTIEENRDDTTERRNDCGDTFIEDTLSENMVDISASETFTHKPYQTLERKIVELNTELEFSIDKKQKDFETSVQISFEATKLTKDGNIHFKQVNNTEMNVLSDNEIAEIIEHIQDNKNVYQDVNKVQSILENEKQVTFPYVEDITGTVGDHDYVADLSIRTDNLQSENGVAVVNKRTNIDVINENIDNYDHIMDNNVFNLLIPVNTYKKRCTNQDTTFMYERKGRKSVKRKQEMTDIKFNEKRYRKGKNIDHPKYSISTKNGNSYSKEYSRLFDYNSSLKFSYSRPFHKEHIEVHELLQNWPLTTTTVIENLPEKNQEELLFLDLENAEKLENPESRTLADELLCKDIMNDSSNSDEIKETNFNMGFGERSGRVIQNLEDGVDVSEVSAATLSDVKQNQPVLQSINNIFLNTQSNVKHEDKAKNDLVKSINLYYTSVQLKNKVKDFFNSSSIKLKLMQDSKKNNKELDDYDTMETLFGLTSSNFIHPPLTEIAVQVVQVGQLPVSAAAQNPVTCDPRVTQVSNASPPQCSAENSLHDDQQMTIKTEYTELTTADITLPMVHEYEYHESVPYECRESSNIPITNENIPIQTEIKSVVKIELMEEEDKMESNDMSDHNEYETPDEENVNHVDYSFEVNINPSPEPTPNMEIMYHESQNQFSPMSQQNGYSEKTDQIAHAMNAAGISTTNEPIPHSEVTEDHDYNILSQNSTQETTLPNENESYPKTASINTMALQQALSQIVPPSNQSNGIEHSQQSPNVSSQVLHIVQGKNSSGSPVTLVDNAQPSVINTPNATPVLHIVQNKSASGNATSTGAPSTQSNTFSGLSIVDAALQKGGNQLLHIMNAANQNNNNAGQLLKRVNLLTNLTNAQGGNEQKMVQFVCKSADGKAIQLNTSHQRSMVLRLQPVDTSTVQNNTTKATENPQLSPTHNVNSNNDASQEKSRAVYEDNYTKFMQGGSTPGAEKSTSLPKFNQAFGKQVFQEDKQNELNGNSHLSSVSSEGETSECPPQDNPLNLDHMSHSPPLILRKSPPQTTQSQPNIVQQIKDTIAPMNIQTMHGGVIYTRQIPVNIGGGQTINLITVPTTELVDESGQKQATEVKFVNQNGIEPSIIKIVPQTQPATNGDSAQENSSHPGGSNENHQTPQPQPVLTQMRIKLPMLSKAPNMVSGTRVIRPSFFHIQRNVIGGANQQVYQQLVLTAAPPLGQQTIRLPQAQNARPQKTENQSTNELQMSTSTLEQLREFDLVLEQVKERSTVQPNGNVGAFANVNTTSTDTTDSAAKASSTTTETTQQQILYSIGNTQPLNVAYVNRKTTVPTPTTSTYVRSPDSSGIVDSSTSSSPVPSTSHTVTTEARTSDAPHQPKKSHKSKPRPKASSNPPNTLKLTPPPKPSSQKPLEDEQTTQRILYILAEYKEQVENSPDKDKPAPRRRNHLPAALSGSSKRKKSSGSRRHGPRDVSPIHGDETCRTMGSEDSSCGTSLGDCNDSCIDSHSPQGSPRKVVRKLTFDHEPHITQPRPQPPRNVIVADGQTITVARGTAGKPTTAVLMPANYILPVSMVKGGQQIAIVTNRGPKLLTVSNGGEGGTTNALLLQRLIGPAGLKPVLTRPGFRHVRLPAAALHNLQAFNLTTATTVQPPDSTASPAPAPTPPDLVETQAANSPWTDRESQEVKPERGSSPEGSEPWNLHSVDPHDYSYEETVRTENMDRTVLVVHKREGHRQHRLTHVSAAALRHKYAILEHELRLQCKDAKSNAHPSHFGPIRDRINAIIKSLSEECEDLGVDSPSASELFPEAELLFTASPAHDHAQEHLHSTQPIIHIPKPDLEDQIATDRLISRDVHDRADLNILEDVGIVTVSEDGLSTTIALNQEEFARAHPNTTFHSEPSEEGEIQPFTIAGLKGRINSTIFHRGPGTVLVTAPQTTVISQATAEPATSTNTVKYSDIENMIDSLPGSQNNINLPSVLVKEDGLRFDSLLADSREVHVNTTSAIVHSSGNATQVIRRVCFDDDKREKDGKYLIDEPDMCEKMDDISRDAALGMHDDRSPERHSELFWDSTSMTERMERRRRLDFSDSDKCCKSPFDESDSGIGVHMRLDSVIKEARVVDRNMDGPSIEDNHPPLRTYPPKRLYHNTDTEMDRNMSGKTRAGIRSPDMMEGRRRSSVRGVVKRGCHCCNGSPAPPRAKKSRPKKPTMDFTN